MPGQAAVEGDEQVQALLLPHLADDHPVGPHAQRLLDQAAQPDLAGALEVGLPRLHRHPVRQRQPELEDLLAGDDALARRDRRGQAVEHRRLPGLRAAGDDDVEAGRDGRLEETRPPARSACRAATSSSSVLRGQTNLRMLTAQCRRVMSGITTCSRQPSGSIASTNGVDRSTRRPAGLQHLLDEVADLARRRGSSWSARCARAARRTPGRAR